MLDRALLRLPDDMRRYLRAVDWMACDGCEICEAEARQTSSDRGKAAGAATQRRATRFRS